MDRTLLYDVKSIRNMCKYVQLLLLLSHPPVDRILDPRPTGAFYVFSDNNVKNPPAGSELKTLSMT